MLLNTRGATKKPPTKRGRENSSQSEGDISINIDDASELKSKLTEMKNCMLTKEDLKSIVSDITSSFLQTFREEFSSIQEKLDQTLKDNVNLKEENKKLTLEFAEIRSINEHEKLRTDEAIRMANYNEQYSRKNNIRVLGLQNDSDLDNKQAFIQSIQRCVDISIKSEENQAIHPLPARDRNKPVITLVKLSNTDIKGKIMMKKKQLSEKGITCHDDITKKNLTLMNRAKDTDICEKAWYFNGQIYAKAVNKVKVKIDLYDDIQHKLSAAQNEK
ncbi:hypothetical protein SNE40_009727 [Patella caerulea]|uniref:Uncharacterized protein n=1 Tax=Patella caerulea TaxID=87958 RepID=A0AAN8JQ59_PATCE